MKPRCGRLRDELGDERVRGRPARPQGAGAQDAAGRTRPRPVGRRRDARGTGVAAAHGHSCRSDSAAEGAAPVPTRETAPAPSARDPFLAPGERELRSRGGRPGPAVSPRPGTQRGLAATQGSSLRSYLHSGQCHNPTNSTNYYLSQGHGVGRPRRAAPSSCSAAASSPPPARRLGTRARPTPARRSGRGGGRGSPRPAALHPAPGPSGQETGGESARTPREAQSAPPAAAAASGRPAASRHVPAAPPAPSRPSARWGPGLRPAPAGPPRANARPGRCPRGVRRTARKSRAPRPPQPAGQRRPPLQEAGLKQSKPRSRSARRRGGDTRPGPRARPLCVRTNHRDPLRRRAAHHVTAAGRPPAPPSYSRERRGGPFPASEASTGTRTQPREGVPRFHVTKALELRAVPPAPLHRALWKPSLSRSLPAKKMAVLTAVEGDTLCPARAFLLVITLLKIQTAHNKSKEWRN
nr:translation initiation factor IF-2-like [Equus asinus]